MTRHLRVLHVTGSLDAGGVNAMLEELVKRGRHYNVQSEVVSLLDDGVVGERLVQNGISVSTLHMGRRFPNPTRIAVLTAQVRRLRPDVVQTWTYHADLVGAIAAWSAGRIPVVWGVHHARLDADLKRRTRFVATMCARLSWLPERIVCVSHVGRERHAELGYRRSKLVVIRNGVDTTRFRPDMKARESSRLELGISTDAPVIGVVARDHPHKGVRHFLAAAAEFRRWRDAHFVMCGAGLDSSNEALTDCINEAGLQDRVHRLGRRGDVERILNALDVFASASEEEALPVAVLEAMSCGVPCVVTDVGDSAFLVGATGRVVAARDHVAIAKAWSSLLALAPDELRDLGAVARARILADFDIQSVAGDYYRLYREVAEATSGLN